MRDPGPMAGASGTVAPERLLDTVCAAIEAIVRAGEPYGGLFPSLVDRRTGAMLEALPPPIAGQRMGDRAHLGTNLIHDEALLATMYALAVALGRADYAAAADRYLQRWATHCTDTETGLFPWGEHTYWHLRGDRVGDSHRLARPDRSGSAIHDHLRQAPLWLWEKLWTMNPRCVERFAQGLDYHWKAGEPSEYTRHAPIAIRQHPSHGPRACDFPRHSGFYILDWAFAFAKTGRADFLAQIKRALDHWWTKRDGRGLLLIESRSPRDATRFFDVNAPPQTLSLAVSLCESAALLDGVADDTARAMRTCAGVYADGFLAAPHAPADGVFVILSGRDANDVREAMPIWGSRYGLWPTAYVALTALCGYRHTADARLLAWAEAAGRWYTTRPFPRDVQVPAMDAGLGLGLLADLYNVTGDSRWLDAALRVAIPLVAVYWEADADQRERIPLPRGAAGIDWYESQMGPSFLLHGLARVALLRLYGQQCPLQADYTAR